MCMSDYRRGLDWWIDLLTTHIYDSKIQTITTPPLISTIHKSPQHPLRVFPAYYDFISRSLATASNSGDSSASRAQVLSSQPPAHNSLNLLNPLLRTSRLPLELVSGAVSPGIKRLGRESDHSPLSSIEVRNDGAIPSLPIRLHGVLLN
jgi:hypothetical protein